MIDLDRFYSLLEARSGLVRKRDPRLERIAADRALEARYMVGTDGSADIPHPVTQLIARTWPLQGSFKGVWENALWNYSDAFVADFEHQCTEGWWASTQHRANLQRPEATTWGLGVHVEPPTGSQRNPRIYAINIFTRDLMTPVVVTSGTSFPDALSAGPLAADLGTRILLTERTYLPVATRDRLVELQPSEIIVIGGTAVVSDAVKAALSAIAPVRRVAGSDRYATAVAVSTA